MPRGCFTKVILDTVRLIVNTNGLPTVAIACWCSISLLDCDTGRARTLSVPHDDISYIFPIPNKVHSARGFLCNYPCFSVVNLHSKWLGTVMRLGLRLEPSVLTSTLVLKLKAEGTGRIRLPSLLLMLFGLGHWGVNALHFLVVYVLFVFWL